MTLSIQPATPLIGATVSGIDLSRPLEPEDVDAIEAALLDHLVLFFRGQDLTESQHIAFARHFGEIQPPPLKTRHDPNPELHVLDQTSPRGEGADNWHADHTYTKRPAMGSILRAVQLPSIGGDTLFASMIAAYDALSEPMKRLLEGLTAQHDVRKSASRGIRAGHLDVDLAEIRRRLPPVTHPVIRTHPVTGRKIVFVNRNSTVRILELSQSESDSVLRFLFEHVRTPELQVRFKWDTHSLVFLDNRCTQHYAVPDYHERRILHRVTIAGDEPF